MILLQKDFDLFRQILFEIEKIPYGGAYASDIFSGDIEYMTKIAEHLEMLSDAGFIVLGTCIIGFGYPLFPIERMTNAGHDYLDAVRDQTSWSKTKDKLLTLGSSASLAIVSSIVEGITTVALKENL